MSEICVKSLFKAKFMRATSFFVCAYPREHFARDA